MSSKPPAPPPKSGGGAAPPIAAPRAAAQQQTRTPPPSPFQGDERSPKAVVPAAVELNLTSGVVEGADSIVIYGTEGIGKSTLASYLPSPLFLDVDGSTRKIQALRDMDIGTWPILRGKVAKLASSPPGGVRSVVLDTATVAQALAVEYVVETRRVGGGKEGPLRKVASIEDFGWGRGWHYVFDEFDALIADFDRLRERGLIVCFICHAVPSVFPNPAGEDFTRYEPHLHAGDKNRRGSIRNRVSQWAEHVLFLGYDLFVRDGKGVGSGSRTIHTFELPTHVAKSRTAQVAHPFDINDPGSIWRVLGIEK